MTQTAGRGGLLRLLPEIYHGSKLVRGIVTHYDELLAAFAERIETAHLDYGPMAPAPFLDWVGGWLGLEPDALLDDLGRRALFTFAPTLNRMRGTKAGLTARLAAGLGLDPAVIEVRAAEDHAPGGDPTRVVIVVKLFEAGATWADERVANLARQAARLVEEQRPAHAVCELMIQKTRPSAGGAIQP